MKKSIMVAVLLLLMLSLLMFMHCSSEHQSGIQSPDLRVLPQRSRVRADTAGPHRQGATASWARPYHLCVQRQLEMDIGDN